MYRVELLHRLRYEDDLRQVFRYNIDLTPKILEDIKARRGGDERKNWVIVQINGETGSMKSSVALSLMSQYIDASFLASRVTQEYSVFEELLSDSLPGQGFILDEMVFQRGVGSMRLQESIVNLSETLRKRENSMIFVTPTEKFISNDNVNYTLEPCGFDEKTKIVRCLVRKKRYLGFFYCKLLWNHPLWLEYEKGKDAFIEKSAQQKYKKVNYEKIARDLLVSMPDEYIGKKKRLTLYVEKNAPNLTKEERDLLIEQMIIFIESV